MALIKNKQELKKGEFQETDPFVELQKYIAAALKKGVSHDNIKKSLLDNSWDELVVDEEIEKALIKHMQ